MLLHFQKRNTGTHLARLAVFVFLSFALVIATTAQTCAALIASGDVTVSAGKNVSITAAQQTGSMQSSASSRKSGLFADDDGASSTPPTPTT